MFSKSWKKIICSGFTQQAIKNDACKFYGNRSLCPNFEIQFMLWFPQNKNLTEKLPLWNYISLVWKVMNLWLILTVPAARTFRGSSYFQKASINLCYGKHWRSGLRLPVFHRVTKGTSGEINYYSWRIDFMAVWIDAYIGIWSPMCLAPLNLKKCKTSSTKRQNYGLGKPLTTQWHQWWCSLFWAFPLRARCVIPMNDHHERKMMNNKALPKVQQNYIRDETTKVLAQNIILWNWG